MELFANIASEQKMKDRYFAIEGGSNLQQWNRSKEMKLLQSRAGVDQVMSPHGCESRERTTVISNCSVCLERLEKTIGHSEKANSAYVGNILGTN